LVNPEPDADREDLLENSKEEWVSMRKYWVLMMAIALGSVLAGLLAGFAAPQEAGDMLAHNVYFRLKDPSDAAKARLVDACRKYLKDHPGVVFFAAGTLAGDMNREVNDRDFEVALHLVFKTKADHDTYQVHEKHKRFIEENQANWARVRVFDSYVK
jgi:hypothetical protein